jgi:hypothetical protein
MACCLNLPNYDPSHTNFVCASALGSFLCKSFHLFAIHLCFSLSDGFGLFYFILFFSSCFL